MANIDIAMGSFAGFPGYKGDAPKNESDFNLIFNDENPWINKPSWQEIQTKLLEVECQRNRAKEYPSFADQFDTLYHGGYDAWKAQIDAIKAKYPKV